MFSSIRSKVYLVLTILATALTTQAIFQFIQSDRIREEMVYLAGTQVDITEQLHTLQMTTIQVQQWLTDISATRGEDGLNYGLTEAKISADHFREAISQLRKLDTRSGINYPALLPIMDDYYDTGVKMANAYMSNGTLAGNKVMVEFNKSAEHIHHEIDAIEEQLLSAQAAVFAHELAAIETAEYTVVLFFCLYVLLLITLVWGVRRFVLAPINKILIMTESLSSGDGDLTQRLTMVGRNEIGALARSFNTFLSSTDEMVSQVTKSVVRLIPMAKELASSNADIEIASVSQAEHSQHVSDYIGQTKESAHEVSLLIKQITASVRNNVTALDSGQKVAQETIQGMDKLSSEINLVSDAVMRLSDDSSKIESIIDVINSISEQTNLLALNAAIEAARAGEAGRGFAVVADEVRTLATKTKNSTEEIQAMITSIQSGTLQAAKTMEKGLESTRNSVTQVNQSAETLKELAVSMAEINIQSEKIEKETELQNTHFTAVTENIDKMDSQFSKTLEHLDENLNFGTDLNKLSEKLYGLIGKFKVTDTEWSDSVRTQSRKPEESKPA